MVKVYLAIEIPKHPTADDLAALEDEVTMAKRLMARANYGDANGGADEILKVEVEIIVDE